MCRQVRLFLEDGSPAPTQPVAGQEFIALTKGDVVDVILQNLAANANGATPLHHSVSARKAAPEGELLGVCMRAMGACVHACMLVRRTWGMSNMRAVCVEMHRVC